MNQVGVESTHLVAITAVGLLQFSDDVSPELAAETIERIRIRGVFRAPEVVKQVLSDRIE